MNKIMEFWQWFVRHEAEIIKAVENHDHDWLRTELTPRVTALTPQSHSRPRINWEIGRGSSKQWRFCLSPLIKQNLAATRKVIENAPPMIRWEFLPAKPPRNTDRLDYTLVDEEGDTYTFQADDWDYVLLDHGNGMFSVDLIGDVPKDLDSAFRTKAAYLIVEGILGEEFSIEHIGDVRLISQHEADRTLPSTKLLKLRRHLQHVLSKMENSGREDTFSN